MPRTNVKVLVPPENPSDRTAIMNYSTLHQNIELTRANARRFDRETELRRRNAETMDARAADARAAEPGTVPARVIRRAWQLVTSRA